MIRLELTALPDPRRQQAPGRIAFGDAGYHYDSIDLSLWRHALRSEMFECRVPRWWKRSRAAGTVWDR